MSLYESVLQSVFPSLRPAPSSGTILYETVSGSNALENRLMLPHELRIVMERHRDIDGEVQALLARGVTIGVRSLSRSSALMLEAVRTIAVQTQHRLISPWLRPLLMENISPVFTPEDRIAAARNGIDLDARINALREVRTGLKVLVLIDDRGRPADPADVALIARMNTALASAALEYAVNRIEFDNANERTEVAQTIIKAMVIIGPIAHFLEHLVSGIGKVVAASTDDVMSEIAELSALRGSGFTWRQLMMRSRILIPVFILATYGAFSVESFVRREEYAIAGLLFGLSAVALSLTTALQSVAMYKQCVDAMCADGKLMLPPGRRRWRVAIHQDFANPARLGLLIGACLSPVMAILVFVLLPQFTHNGWVLALLGTTETVVAGSTVMLARRINDVNYSRRILKSM